MAWIKKKFPPGVKTRKKKLGQQLTNQHETEAVISSLSHQCNAQRKYNNIVESAARLRKRYFYFGLQNTALKPIAVQNLSEYRPCWPHNKDFEKVVPCSRQNLLMSGGSLLMERSCTIEELQFRELEEQVWLLMWLVLEPKRLQYLVQKYGNERMSRRWAEGRWGSWLVWRALLVSCSADGTKSASPVRLDENHVCDMPCLRDHVSRLLEICAPTRDYWRMFGWTGLSVDAILQKIISEDIMPMVHSLQVVPPELQASLTRLADYRRALEKEKETKTYFSERDQNVKSATAVPTMPRKRGRPAKAATLKGKEPGRIERVFLWKFLLELLEDPTMRNCLRWLSREEGIFRILNTDLLARLWGRRHGNPGMTYEKLARAMRTYYRSGTFLMVPRCRNLPRKLVYRFSPSTMQKFWQRSHPHGKSPLSDPESSLIIDN
ncbi:Hypothetical predicted protein [Cloeon dipterum]|uniref:ETS domain-containing protein n=1 Tax=Cloeon dipterum TaxID=197152 RepID=A0A8S1DS53_9INSE|nr:Hypothetical predicted protein [Cloeon dipterum]CAB3380978.1 Hypothetical predicted protein [Cloeon dipterum]